ncbi:hypothetical protein NsoK4_04470 [Nitrosopumilus sp. K4]|uniref:hypothetical protein n=1 Tax=Nitrosopumilus sp. K4 TaxID=2795383 RepID=UPI001BA814D8|nr:hypothetical protein [Nitrosopumilus sp. K4]QUC65498.1 hypothetical protein NsoK4_04470 [Nitrosopumilus sp. K4]
MSNAMVYAGIAIGVAAIAAAIVYATENQQNFVPEDAVLAPAAEQGSFTPESGLGPQLNKERWHDDPFADEAAAVRANAGK